MLFISDNVKLDEQVRKSLLTIPFKSNIGIFGKTDDLNAINIDSYERICILQKDTHTNSVAGFNEVSRIRSRNEPNHSFVIFTKIPDKIAILIQGKDSNTIDVNTMIYFCYGTPLDGTWNKQDLDATLHYQTTHQITNYQNVYLQCCGTLAGIRKLIIPHSNCFKFMIKARSDEYYTNLNPIISIIQENPSIVCTNNVFFRKHTFLYHPSDHMIAGTVDNLEIMFDAAKTALELKNYDPQFLKVAEQVICGSYIKAREGITGLPRDRPTAITLMKKYIDVVPLKDLGYYNVIANCVQMVLTPFNAHLHLIGRYGVIELEKMSEL